MRTVYATALEVGTAPDADAALDAVGRWIEDWYRRRRLTIDVAGTLVDGEAVLAPTDGHQLSIRRYVSEAAQDAQLTDIRWAHPDQYDPSLGWVTSLSLLRRGPRLLVSLDLAVTGLRPVIAPTSIKLGSPRVVRDIARLRSVRLAGHPYSLSPELLGAQDVDVLAAELLDSARPYPVIVVSRRIPDEFPLVDSADLAERLAGAAKVYELADKWAGFRMTEELGKAMSCYGGAVRLYWPGFQAQADPYQHPLWMPWQLKDAEVGERSLRQLCNLIFDAAAVRHVEPTAIAQLRLAAEREAREAARNSNARSEQELKDDLTELERRLKDVEASRTQLLEENRTLRENAAALSAHAWKPEASALPEPSPTATDAVPPASVVEAVQRSEAGAKYVRYLASAHESADDSPYKQPERVQQALSALEEVAAIWVATLESGKAGRPIRELFKQRGFEYSDDVSQTSKGRWGDEYAIAHEGQRLDISPHITLGAKQADTCISIHWAWHRAEKVAVVAHVGRHKTNTKT